MTTQPIQLQPEHVKISAGFTLAAYLTRKLGRLLLIAIRSPAKLLALVPLAAAYYLHTITTWLVFSLTLFCLCIAAAWAMQFPHSYKTQIAGRARGTIRSLLVYRWRWASGLKKCGVILHSSEAPLLLRTNSTPQFDRLLIRMVPGQRPEDYANHADRMTQTFGALNCRIMTTDKPHWLELLFLTKDPLIAPVDPYPPEPDVLDNGLPIARTEDGKPWRLKLVGSHLLIVGSTGSGKSGVLWGIIHSLIPAIQAKLVKLWVMDPKGGMELAGGRHWYDRFIYGHQPRQFANVLQEAVTVMQARQEALRGVAQLHTPTTRQPLYVIIIDELAALTAWNTDRKAQTRIQTNLGLLLSQGRAVGIIIIGAIQDPGKDVLPLRDLFPTRIALRLAETAQVAMVFGPGSTDAPCQQIDPALKGVGYVHTDGEDSHTRVRFAHITPAMIGETKGDLPPIDAEPEPSTTRLGVA